MSKFKVYLAGKMSGLTLGEMNGWREQAKKLFNSYAYDILAINPVEFYNFELDKSTYTEHEVKFFDLYQVKNSDIVLVNLDEPNSIGTAIEMHEAHDNWNIPVIAFGDKEDNAHPWMKLSVTKHFDTLEEAVEYILIFYHANR